MQADRQQIQILQAEIDPDGESDLRVLVNDKHIKYLKIDEGVYSPEDIGFAPSLIELLPDLPPAGDWNLCHISRGKTAQGKPSMTWGWHNFPTIAHTWHPIVVDYLDLRIGRKLRSNVYEARSPESDADIVIKFARYAWEIAYMDSETAAYALMEGFPLAPRFLGHIREGDRIIGFMIEKITDCRHAEVADHILCQGALAMLHDTGILHGDVNKYNFLVQKDRAIMIDFESAQRCSDPILMMDEQAKLVKELESISGKGGSFVEEATS